MVSDVIANGVHQGVDTITDFRSSETLDLWDFTKGLVEDYNSVIHIDWQQGDTATTVSVLVGDAFVEVAHLIGVRGGDANAWASDGMILA